MTTVIVGGGIVGVTAALYLLKKGAKVILVEKCGVACHSSGKAGGFLTDGDSGWHSGSIGRLAKRSFALHEELAKELGAEKIGFRRVKCLGLGSAEKPPGEAGIPQPAWLAKEYQRDMGNESGLAQVTPYKLMEALQEAITKQGCEIVIAKAVGVEVDGDTVTGWWVMVSIYCISKYIFVDLFSPKRAIEIRIDCNTSLEGIDQSPSIPNQILDSINLPIF